MLTVQNKRAAVYNVNLFLYVIAHAWLCSSNQAETRAEFAERSVAKLEKTIDDLEGKKGFHLIFRMGKTHFVSSLLKSTKSVATGLQGFLRELPSVRIKGNSSLAEQYEIMFLLIRC